MKICINYYGPFRFKTKCGGDKNSMVCLKILVYLLLQRNVIEKVMKNTSIEISV